MKTDLLGSGGLPQLTDQEVYAFFREGSKSSLRKWLFVCICCVASLVGLNAIPFGQTEMGGAVTVGLLCLSLVVFFHLGRRRYLASQAMRDRILAIIDSHGCLFAISSKALLYVNPKSNWFGYDVIAVSRIFGWSYESDVLKITPKELDSEPEQKSSIYCDFSELPSGQRLLVASKLKELLKKHPDLSVSWAKYFNRTILMWIVFFIIFLVLQFFGI